MRAIWKGTISFGLVNIPIALIKATRREELKFRLLRKSDLSPVNYKRVAEADGKEVPWDQIVKGYEFEKGQFVVLKDEDFKRVDVEATQTVDIVDFVKLDEINPMFYDQPYYMEPQKGADKAYCLLREALQGTGKVGIAKVVIKTRQYLAAVKPQKPFLLLELMNFADELVDADELRAPREAALGKEEMAMADTLLKNMTHAWKPEKYTDDYREGLLKVIQEKIAAGGRELPVEHKAGRQPTPVIDLVAVLQKSLERTGAPASKAPAKPAKKGARKERKTATAAA